MPQSYLAQNWPIRYSSLSTDGRLVAIGEVIVGSSSITVTTSAFVFCILKLTSLLQIPEKDLDSGRDSDTKIWAKAQFHHTSSARLKELRGT